jgi:hypothetical protein
MATKDLGGDVYSLDPDVDRLAREVVAAIARATDRGPDFGPLRVEKMHKTRTLVMRADRHNAEPRFRPGSRLRTYTGVRGQDGRLLDETYAGDAWLTEQSTIYRSVGPLRYADDDADPSQRGQPIRGRFEADGTFVETAKGNEILFNEYATEDSTHAKSKYGVDPMPGKWTHGTGQITSYLLEIPKAKPEVLLKAGSGKLIAVKSGDFLVFDVFGDGRVGVQGLDRASKNAYRAAE